jgi:hypothetical protein
LFKCSLWSQFRLTIVRKFVFPPLVLEWWLVVPFPMFCCTVFLNLNKMSFSPFFLSLFFTFFRSSFSFPPSSKKTKKNCTAIDLPPLKYLGFSNWHFWEFPHKHGNLDF